MAAAAPLEEVTLDAAGGIAECEPAVIRLQTELIIRWRDRLCAPRAHPPGRFIAGLALEFQGDRDKARGYYQPLPILAKDAHSERPELRQAKPPSPSSEPVIA